MCWPSLLTHQIPKINQCQIPFLFGTRAWFSLFVSPVTKQWDVILGSVLVRTERRECLTSLRERPGKLRYNTNAQNKNSMQCHRAFNQSQCNAVADILMLDRFDVVRILSRISIWTGYIWHVCPDSPDPSVSGRGIIYDLWWWEILR